MNELVKQLPDGVYVTSLKQDNQIVSIQGVAQSNERVSELLRNLGNNSPWLSKPELVEITAGNVALSTARPAPGRQLHHAGEAAARQRGAESRVGGQRRIRRCPASAPAAVASAPAKT